MKLLYCIPSLSNCGGTERVLSTRLNYLAQHTNNELYVVLTESHGGEPYFYLDSRIKIINLEIDFSADNSFVKKLVNYRKRLRQYKCKLLALLKEVKPDIITSLLSHEIDFLHTLNDGSLKIGENHFNRDFRYLFVKNNTKNFFYRIIAKYRDYQLGENVKKLDALVTLTEADANLWDKSLYKRIIPNPLSFTTETKSQGETKRIIAAGRLSREKGFDLLLQAWEKIFKSFPNWTLDIYGEGTEYDNLQEYIKRKKLARVRICPFKKEIAKEFIQSDFYVLSSRFEGFGLVLIEAMECGLPVVAFDCKTGPREIVTNNLDGFLVKDGDIDSLAKAMSVFMNNDELLKKMSLAAIIKSEKYKINNIMKEWIGLYQTLNRK